MRRLRDADRQTPFSGDNEFAVRWAHASESRPLVSRVLPTLGHRYDGFFQTALAIDPEQRFASGREFAEALASAQSSTGDTDPTAVMAQTHAATQVGPVTPPPPGVGYQNGPQAPPPYGYVTPPPQQRDRSGNPLALILLAIVAVVGIAAAVLAATGVFNKESSPGSRPPHTPSRCPSKEEARSILPPGPHPVQGQRPVGQQRDQLPVRQEHRLGVRGIRGNRPTPSLQPCDRRDLRHGVGGSEPRDLHRWQQRRRLFQLGEGDGAEHERPPAPEPKRS